MTQRRTVRRGSASAIADVLIAIVVWLWVPAVVAQQQPATNVAASTQAAAAFSFAPFLVPAAARTPDAGPVQLSDSFRGSVAAGSANFAVGPGRGLRRITLEEAQQQAATANNPLVQLATLGMEAAKQHRLGVQSEFFPKISSTFANLHFNKLMGQLLEIRPPFRGPSTTVAMPIFYKDQTVVAANMAQAVTPLLKLRQVLAIARADERIARAKAGMPAAEVAGNVEQSYFGLLVAQRQVDVARAKVKKVENRWRLASNSAVPAGVAEREAEWLEANKELILANSKAREAAATLNALLGWPLDTQLELVAPAAFYENVSAEEAIDQAMRNNPEVVEAAETLVKARAAARLSKLDYVPDVAIVGGYAYERIMPTVPLDFSYVGVMANYTLFDFGKRERTGKERNAQVAMAETGLTLVKAKVAAGVTKAYFELDRSRRLSELAQRMNAAKRAIEVKYEPEEAKVARAKSEADMLQADLEHRLAFSRLQQLIGPARATTGK